MSCQNANRRCLCFLGEAGWPVCFKVTLGIMAIRQQRDLGVEARGRGEERKTRPEGWTRDKDGVEILGFEEKAEASWVEQWVSPGEPGQTPGQKEIPGGTQASLPISCLETQRGFLKLSHAHTLQRVPNGLIFIKERARKNRRWKKEGKEGKREAEEENKEKKVCLTLLNLGFFNLIKPRKSFPLL